jgi:PIN domain nuclease of toxin-antitoxin system
VPLLSGKSVSKRRWRESEFPNHLSKEPPDALERHHFRPLPIDFQHALAVRNLPYYHRDPFDRMLIAQAQCEDLILMTADPRIAAYGIRTLDASK